MCRDIDGCGAIDDPEDVVLHQNRTLVQVIKQHKAKKCAKPIRRRAGNSSDDLKRAPGQDEITYDKRRKAQHAQVKGKIDESVVRVSYIPADSRDDRVRRALHSFPKGIEPVTQPGALQDRSHGRTPQISPSRQGGVAAHLSKKVGLAGVDQTCQTDAENSEAAQYWN